MNKGYLLNLKDETKEIIKKIAQDKGMPLSVYIRVLIHKDIEKEREKKRK